MAETETDHQETTAEASDDAAVREKWVDRFEKLFRLMDSPVEGEAAAAFRQAKAVLPKIGVTFGTLLEMLNGGQSEDLQQLVEQYKTANEGLKIAENVLLQENSRLNFLLRNFRDAKMQSSGLDVNDFKNAAAQVLNASKEVAEELKGLQLPETAEDMETLYKTRIAEGLSLRGGHEGDGLLERFLLWSLSAVAKRDFSDDAVFRLQDLVQAQEQKIKELSDLFRHVTALQEQAQDISGKLDIIVAESAPKAAYDEAMQHLKDLQIAMGDGKDLKALKAQNEALQVENGLLHRQIAELVNMTAMSSQTAGQAPGAQGQATAAQQGQPSQQQQKTAAFHVLKGMEEMMELKDKEISDLRSQLAQDRAEHVLSTDDLALMTSLAQALPTIDRAAKTLELASERYAAAEAEKKEKFFRRVFSFGKGKKDKKRADKSAQDMREITNSAREVAGLMDKLMTSFNAAAAAQQKEMVESVTAFEKSSKERLTRHFEDARWQFEAGYEAIEATHTRKINGLQATADSLDAQIRRLETLRADRERFEQDYQDAVAKALAAAPGAAGEAVSYATTEQEKIATSFMWKAYNAGDTKHVDFCLKKGANVNARDAKGFTMLICAVWTGNIPMVDLLLSREADISLTATSDKKTAFDYLAETKIPSDVKKTIGEKLLQALPDVKAAKSEVVATLNAENQKAATKYLWEAYRAGDLKKMELCLRKGANIEEKENGYSLIQCAVIYANMPMMDFLLSQGADAASKNTSYKKNCFDYVAEAKVTSDVRVAMTEKLLNSLPDRVTSPKNGAASTEQLQAVNNLMWQVFNAGNRENIALCLKKGADVNATDGNGYTMLMQAIKQGDQQMAEFVLSKGPDILVKNKYDYQTDAFGYLQKSYSFSAEIKAGLHQKLLQALPDRIRSPKNGAVSTEQLQAINNLMWQAFDAGNRENIELCLKKGANINATDGNGFTMLMQAIRQGNQQMAEFVLSEGPDVLVKNKYDYQTDAFGYLQKSSSFSPETKAGLHQKLLQALPGNAVQTRQPALKMAI